MYAGTLLFALLPCLAEGFLVSSNPRVRKPVPNRKDTHLFGMDRPILDQIATTLFKLEQNRVVSSSVVDDKGRLGEPMEWSERDSLANTFSEIIAVNNLGYRFKQTVADIVAGDFDEEIVQARVDLFIDSNAVAVFSFTSCPFCRRAKDFLEENSIPYTAMELDELEGNEGNEIRAVLGRKTRRTSVPSIFIGGTYIGGCNDGPGLLPLAENGDLDVLLKKANENKRNSLIGSMQNMFSPKV